VLSRAGDTSASGRREIAAAAEQGRSDGRDDDEVMTDQADGAIIVTRRGRRGVLEADADSADEQEHEPQV
jgi:hypothetical protein